MVRNVNVIPEHSSMKAKDVPLEERKKIVLEVVNEHISPAILSEKYGINVTQIRTWVREEGYKLPSRYKTTKMKPP